MIKHTLVILLCITTLLFAGGCKQEEIIKLTTENYSTYLTVSGNYQFSFEYDGEVGYRGTQAARRWDLANVIEMSFKVEPQSTNYEFENVSITVLAVGDGKYKTYNYVSSWTPDDSITPVSDTILITVGIGGKGSKSTVLTLPEKTAVDMDDFNPIMDIISITGTVKKLNN